MLVRFRTVTGKIFGIKLRPEDTLLDAKTRLKEEECFDTSNCCFIFCGMLLEDTTKIAKLAYENAFILIHSNVKPKIVQREGDYENKPAKITAHAEESPGTHDRAVKQEPQYNDPSNFNEMVQNITEIGFSEVQAMRALRSCNYNADHAVDMLISGHTFEEPPPPKQNDEPNFDRHVSFERNQPSSHGSSSSKYGELQSQFDQLSSEQKAAVQRLERIVQDPCTTLQVFLACNMEERNAEHCLMNMK